MKSRTEQAILLALEAMVRRGAQSKHTQEALKALRKALEEGGWRMPDNEGGW